MRVPRGNTAFIGSEDKVQTNRHLLARGCSVGGLPKLAISVMVVGLTDFHQHFADPSSVKLYLLTDTKFNGLSHMRLVL